MKRMRYCSAWRSMMHCIHTHHPRNTLKHVRKKSISFVLSERLFVLMEEVTEKQHLTSRVLTNATLMRWTNWTRNMMQCIMSMPLRNYLIWPENNPVHTCYFSWGTVYSPFNILRETNSADKWTAPKRPRQRQRLCFTSNSWYNKHREYLAHATLHSRSCTRVPKALGSDCRFHALVETRLQRVLFLSFLNAPSPNRFVCLKRNGPPDSSNRGNLGRLDSKLKEEEIGYKINNQYNWCMTVPRKEARKRWKRLDGEINCQDDKKDQRNWLHTWL